MGNRNCQPYPRGGFSLVWGGVRIDDSIDTPRGRKGGSEEQDEAPLTAAETRERIRLHNEGKAQSSTAQAQVAGDSSKSSDSDSESSNGSSISSGEMSHGKKPGVKRRRTSVTPKKPPSGLQQSGSSSSRKKEELVPAAAAAVPCEARTNMRETADAIKTQLKEYADGLCDAARGRVLQTLHRGWAEHMTLAKKLLKIEGVCEEKRALQLGLQQLEATLALMKAVVKPSGSYLETASCYDTLRLVSGTASDGCARAVLDRNVDAKLQCGELKNAIRLMAKNAGFPHAVHDLLPEGKVHEAQMCIATKVVQATFKVKVAGPIETAQREGADLILLFKHEMGFASFSEELKKQIEVMFACMHSSCADAATMSRAAAFAGRFPVPDARKPPESPLAAFLLSKVGKQAVKSLAQVAATAAKTDQDTKEFAKILDSMKELAKLESITLSQLQLEVMQSLRKAKNSMKGAEPVVVQEALSCARSLFVKFGTDLLARMGESAPFLFDEVDLFDSEQAPEDDFRKNVGELKEVERLRHEIDTDIAPFSFSVVPAAAAGTVAASSLAGMDNFIMYAELAQEAASMTLSETPALSLRSMGSKFIDLLQPETWASIAALVTGLT